MTCAMFKTSSLRESFQRCKCCLAARCRPSDAHSTAGCCYAVNYMLRTGNRSRKAAPRMGGASGTSAATDCKCSIGKALPTHVLQYAACKTAK